MRTPSEINRDGCPVDVFPKAVANFIRDYSAGSGSQEPYVVTGVLACTAGICDESTIMVKDGYEEGCNLFLCNVGPPGVTKTSPMKAALKPLMKLEAQKNKVYKEKREAWENAMKACSKKAEKEQLKENQPKREPCKIVTDGSIEAMFMHMEAQYDSGRQPHCVMVRDELNGFFGGMNKFKKSGGDDNEMWLQLFSGQDIAKTLVARTLFVENARATVIGSMQPEVYRKVMQDKGDGMIDRFLIAIHEGGPEETNIRSQCSFNVIKLYNEFMETISYNKRKKYSFSNCKERDKILDSVQEFHSWAHKLGRMYDVGAFKKWEQCFYRICVLLGELWEKDEMDLETVERAKKLSAFFAVNWIRAKDMAEESDDERVSKKILKVLEEQGKKSSRELSQSLHVKSHVILEALNGLKEAGKVKEYKDGKRLVYEYSDY